MIKVLKDNWRDLKPEWYTKAATQIGKTELMMEHLDRLCGHTLVANSVLARLQDPHAIMLLERELEQTRVQLAACSTVSQGWNEVEEGDYGWSSSYSDILELRKKYERLEHTLQLERRWTNAPSDLDQLRLFPGGVRRLQNKYNSAIEKIGELEKKLSETREKLKSEENLPPKCPECGKR